MFPSIDDSFSLTHFFFPLFHFSFPFRFPFPTCLGTSPISLALLGLFLYYILFPLDSILFHFVSSTLPITSLRSSFFLLSPSSFLLLPLVPCISYFFSSSLLQGLLSTFPYLGSSALVPICFSFNLSSHHTFHVSFTTARMSTSASCAGPCIPPLFVHSQLVSRSLHPGPVSIPL